MCQVRDTVELGFNGNGHLLLDFFGSPSRPLGDYRDIFVSDVGVSLDRQVVE